MADDNECCICDGLYDGYGNNPEPLARWPHRCCDKCNRDEVIPARLAAYLGISVLTVKEGLR